MLPWIYKNLPLLCVILTCLIGKKRTKLAPESFCYQYRKLDEEEKRLYDIHKIRQIGEIWFYSLILITILFLIGKTLFPQVNFLYMFVALYAIDFILYLLFSYTKWGLTLFCKTSGK